MRFLKGLMLMLVSLVLVLGAAVAFAEPEPIKVGAILSVTGPVSFLGAPEARTLEMMAAEINKNGGILGRPLKLIIKDSQGNPETAVSFAKQLIEEEKVLAILGPSTTGETMQIKNLVEQSGTILLSCAAAEVIVNPVGKYVFKTPQKDSYAVKMIYDKMKSMKISKIAILTGNDGFGKAGKDQLEKAAAEYGIKVVLSEVYDKGATDLSAEATKVKNAKVQAVINWSVVPAQSIVIKNIRQIGLKIPIFQSHGFGNIRYVEAAGAAAEGVMFPAGRLLIAQSLPDSHPQKQVLLKYKKDYEGMFNETASTFGGHAYDAMVILTAALKKAGSAEKEPVRNAIESLSGLVGTGGIFNFTAQDHNGLDLSSFEMLTVKGGKFVAMESLKADKKGKK